MQRAQPTFDDVSGTGEKAQAFTQLLCPSNVRTHLPVSAIHSFNVLSADAEHTYLLSYETSQQYTAPLWPRMDLISPGEAIHLVKSFTDAYSYSKLAAREEWQRQ